MKEKLLGVDLMLAKRAFLLLEVNVSLLWGIDIFVGIITNMWLTARIKRRKSKIIG
jgi:glutathione synthase/RimK-type ligase-like ATP-grasp enzyme